jgi:hypothetical protein
MTQTTKTEEEKITEELISLFESISGETLWRDGQVALGSTINSLIISAMEESDPMAFMIKVAAKLQTEFTEK